MRERCSICGAVRSRPYNFLRGSCTEGVQSSSACSWAAGALGMEFCMSKRVRVGAERSLPR